MGIKIDQYCLIVFTIETLESGSSEFRTAMLNWLWLFRGLTFTWDK